MRELLNDLAADVEELEAVADRADEISDFNVVAKMECVKQAGELARKVSAGSLALLAELVDRVEGLEDGIHTQ